jgi:glutaredoxin 3
MYESALCGFCHAAKRLIESKGWSYESKSVDGDAALRAHMAERAGRTSVPQIWIGDTHVGGYDDLAALEADNELEALYERASKSA